MKSRITLLSLGQIATLTFASVALHFVIVMIALWMVGIRVRFLVASFVMAIGAAVAFGSLIAARIDQQASSSQFYGDPLPFLPESVSFRVGVWTQESIPTAFSRPFLGFGMSAYDRLDESGFAPLLQWTSPESEYIRTLVSSGFFGLTFQVVLFVAFLRVLRRCSRGFGRAGFIPMVTFVGILLISAIHAHFTNRGVPLPLYCFVAPLLSLATTGGMARNAPSEGPRRPSGSGSGRRG
ncbi:O-antigen ligase family protein [Nocardioides sp.]|uniref:O-antigen ligase family protein n=1 Tax=Nocardioides sp. TaxID=35761 RepID=UPI00261EA61F|nr:O-antigen ligase family protein [Nocardioides sp.]